MTTWPWNIAAIADGNLIGAELRAIEVGAMVGCQPEMVPGACTNCGGREFMAAWRIEINGNRHYFGPGWGDWRPASLQTQPCPVCQGSVRMEALQDISGLGGLVLDGKAAGSLRLDAFRPETGQVDALEACRRLLVELPSPRTWALFFGGYGTGKTHLLCCLVNACLLMDVAARYTTAEGILRSLRATFDGRHGTEAIRQELENIRVLVVDEIDRVKLSDWAGETLFGILNARYTHGLATWCATNKAPNELEASEVYGALVSRLSSGEMVAITVDDMRPMAQTQLPDRRDGTAAG